MKSLLKPSRIANFIILISVIWCFFNNKFWKNTERVISWDIISYYAYLPATFIYGDVTLKFTDNYKGSHKFIFWPATAPNGGKVIKTSMGLSLLYAPFFFLGHIAAFIGHYDTGGYSAPYKFFLMIGSLFYLMIGLFYLRKILERYFTQWIVAVVLLVTVLATNLYNYVAIETLMPHVYSFTLSILFVWATIKWYEKPKLKYTIMLGLLAGIISLVRPTNALMLLIFVLYNVSSLNELKQRIYLFLSNYQAMLIMALCAILVWLPQLAYWKIITGQWMYYSYGDEHFFFTRPQIINGLISFRKGWLLYTPIMIFAIAGIFFLSKRLKAFSWLIPIFLALNIYIIFSWWTWWYGGGFGGRAFIDSYGLMAIPLALSLQWITEKRPFLKYTLILIFSITAVKGIHYSVQYYYGSIHWDAMCKEAYLDSFWRIRQSDKFQSLLQHPDYEKARQGIYTIEK